MCLIGHLSWCAVSQTTKAACTVHTSLCVGYVLLSLVFFLLYRLILDLELVLFSRLSESSWFLLSSLSFSMQLNQQQIEVWWREKAVGLVVGLPDRSHTVICARWLENESICIRRGKHWLALILPSVMIITVYVATASTCLFLWLINVQMLYCCEKVIAEFTLDYLHILMATRGKWESERAPIYASICPKMVRSSICLPNYTQSTLLII